MKRSFYRWAVGGALALGISGAVSADTFETWAVSGGSAQVQIGQTQITLTIDQSTLEGLSGNRVFRAFTAGSATLRDPGDTTAAYQLLTTPQTDLLLQTPTDTYTLGAWDALLDASSGQFAIHGAQLIQTTGSGETVESRVVGSIGLLLNAAVTNVQVDGHIQPISGDFDWPEICPNPSTGPDVIVGDLPSVGNYGSSGGIYAYSVGTTSCNIGNQTLNWQASTNQHPVIGQNLYRYGTVNGATRIEQIGLSWLKHGFTALAGSLCCPCNNPGTGSLLGLGCSDPYSSGLNGSQGNLGPRSHVNAATGYFPYPFTSPPAGYLVPPPAAATIGRRLQVAAADLDPAQNAGALYFVEGQYVAPDDSAAGNDNNNASYRRVTVGAAPSYTITTTMSTQQQKAGIMAWKDQDASVTLAHVDVPSDGRFTLGYKVTALPSGQYHYEYALYNMNSDRSAQSFAVPLIAGANVTNIGFHDVFYHSGEPYSGTDWTATLSSSSLTWATQTYGENPNANALRWGTLYNFRFDADVSPQDAMATIGLFKPGSPGSVDVATQAPAAGAVQVDIASANPPSAADNPYAPGQPFRDVLDTGSGSSVTAGIGAAGTEQQGSVIYAKIYVTFNGTPAPAPSTANVNVACTGGACPTVMSVAGAGVGPYALTLSGAIPPLNCTTLTFAGTNAGQKLQYQSLPGDVDLSGTSNTADLLWLVQHLNDGSANLPENQARYNIDRSAGGQVNTSDLLRIVQLLNGVNTTQVFNGASVAACP